MKGTRHRLAGDLGRAVEVLVVERVVFGHRLLDGVAVDRGGGGIDKPSHALLDAGFEHVEGAADVDVERGAREVVALQEPQRGEVKDAVGASQRRIENVGLADVAADLVDPDTAVAQRLRQVLGRAAHEIIVNNDLADILAGQEVDGMRADQTGAADHNHSLAANIHGAMSRWVNPDTSMLPQSG